VLTGPNSYGTLRVSNVIHAVGPHYMQYTAEEGDALLTSAYTNSLERAREAGLEAVAFSLLSAGVFRGSRSLREVLRVGVAAMSQFRGYAGLEEVHLCAFKSGRRTPWWTSRTRWVLKMAVRRNLPAHAT